MMSLMALLGVFFIPTEESVTCAAIWWQNSIFINTICHCHMLILYESKALGGYLETNTVFGFASCCNCFSMYTLVLYFSCSTDSSALVNTNCIPVIVVTSLSKIKVPLHQDFQFCTSTVVVWCFLQDHAFRL